MRSALGALLLAACALAPGCGTLLHASFESDLRDMPPYGGAQLDLTAVTTRHPALALPAVLDLPLSLTADTLLLPITLLPDQHGD